MKAQHADEYEIFQKEYEEEKKLRSIVEEKLKIEDKLAKIDKVCKRLREEVEKLENDRELEK